MAGVKGGAIGLVAGAALNGLTSGINSVEHGGNFWDGVGYKEDVIAPKVYSAQKVNSSNYRQFMDAANDDVLNSRVLDEFNVKVGDLKINNITTTTNDYAYNTMGQYVKPNGDVANAYTAAVKSTPKALFANRVDLHVSRYVALNKDVSIFRAYTGHELIHAYHFSQGLQWHNSAFSERVAYKYTYDTLLKGGNLNLAMSELRIAQTTFFGSSCWGVAPATYTIPKVLSIKF